jgi:hypothetical protein
VISNSFIGIKLREKKMELVPLKVKIGLKSDGGKKLHAFPNFNQIDAALRDNMDWSYFIDKFGGWHYDQVSGHVDDDVDSPRDNWNGMFCAPNNFAQAAVSMFPAQCSMLTEAEAEDFYNNRGHIRDSTIKEDTTILQSIKAKRDLGIIEDQADKDALNPDHPSSGRRRNRRKTWAGFKAAEGITVK